MRGMVSGLGEAGIRDDMSVVMAFGLGGGDAGGARLDGPRLISGAAPFRWLSPVPCNLSPGVPL